MQMTLKPPILLLLLSAALSAYGQSAFTCIEVMQPAFPNCSCSNPIENGHVLLDTIVDCSNRGFTAVPENQTATAPYIIRLLDLTDNNITVLPPRAFRGVEAKAIDLRGNAISSVDIRAFEGLTNSLHTLYLQGDRQSQPPKDAFPLVRNLEVLSLSDYNVTHMNFRDENNNQSHGMFFAFTHLRHLTIENWGLEFIAPYTLSHTLRSHLKELILKNNNFYSVPVDAIFDLTSLEQLEITGNPHLQRLNQRGFSTLTSLKSLDLSNNSINLIHEAAFAGLGNSLTTLRLSRNILPHTTPAFKALSSLQLLDLSYNAELTSMPSLVELSTNQSFSLDCRYCAITNLRQSDLAPVIAHLSGLNLADNKLTLIEDLSFQGAIQLQSFVMSNQRGNHPLYQVPSSLRSAAAALRSLKLNGQPINHTSLWTIIPQLTNLEELDLTSTDLSDVPSYALATVTQLRYLLLGYNQLRELRQEALVGPRSSLKHLVLSGNHLTSLSPCIMHQYDSSSPLEMALDLNSWVCNCSLSWMKTYRQSNKISFTTGGEPKCANGGETLLSTPLNCPSNYRDPSCTEHYQTTVSPPDTGSTEPPKVRLVVSNRTENGILVSWTVINTLGLLRINVQVQNAQNNVVFDDEFSSLTTSTTIGIPPLQKGTWYVVCVMPIFSDSQKPECSRIKTQGEAPTDDPEAQKGGSEDVGIIVGAVVGGVILIVLLIAIGYLIFLRRKPKTPPAPNRHVQPRTFTKQELPTMAGPKESMQVVAISDGMAHSSNGSATKPDPQGPSGAARVGRAHLLTSEGSSYKTMGDLKDSRSSSSPYENDRGPLPNPPQSRPQKQAPTHAYYNDAFSKYDEINSEVSF